MEDSEPLKTQRTELQRRLNQRQIQAAQLGITVDPSITNEIEDLKNQIAAINTQIAASTPRADRKNLHKLWQKAMKAYFDEDWIRAEDYILQVATIDPNYADIKSKLADTQTQLYHGICYRAASELKAKGNWRGVLVAMKELEHEKPGYPDPKGLRRWAEEQQQKASTP